MLLRKRQEEFVSKVTTALTSKGNTIGIAPTGAGKTIMMAATVLRIRRPELPSLVLQHRDELLQQNRDKFIQFAGIGNIKKPMTIDASSKAWGRKGGDTNFAMVQTLIRNLDTMPPMGLLAVDEGHHVAADGYMQILHKARQLNPNCLLYATTATPNRGDRKSLRTFFDNCGDQITIGELIQAGHLVRPRSYVMDIGVQGELGKVRRTTADFDMKEVEKVMNKSVLNDKIIGHWREKAGSRQTIVFCSTVDHAVGVTQAFVDHGIKAEMIDGKMGLPTRREILARYDRGEIQVLINVAILTEGFDHQPTSCVVLLRPSSWKSTMVQMIGRGLRKVDPTIYPGITKDDCIVLDFGTSILMHGGLEDEPNLAGSGTKICVECQAQMPSSARECAICGHEFPKTITAPAAAGGGDGPTSDKGVVSDFVMTEIDILNDSPFKYEGFYQGRVMLCFGFKHWAAVVHFQDGRYYAVGAEETRPNNYHLSVVGSCDSYLVALQTADDYMRTHGTKTDASRVAQWLYEQPTEKQLDLLGQAADFGMTKYRACCALQFKFYGNQIRGCINGFQNIAIETAKRYA